MITRIELENFKGVRDRVSLDLKPITLLFGANSSGKSTVIHALHYALEVLRNRNFDADRTTLGGDSIDLGGFRNLVHGHDLERRISMLFEFEADGTLRDYTEGVSDLSTAYQGPHGPGLEGAAMEDRIFTAWVRLEVGWSRALRAPQVFAYEVGANGNLEQPIVRIEAEGTKGRTASLVLHVDDAVFGASVEDEPTELSHLLADAGIEVKGGYASLPVYQESAAPEWGRPLRLWLVDDMTPIPPSLQEVRRDVSMLAVGIGELLVSQLERLLYVGPLRIVPPRSYQPPLTDDLARWAEGLGAWDALHRRGGPLVTLVSNWLKRLGTGYRVELARVREVDEEEVRRLEGLLADLLHYVEVHFEPEELLDGNRETIEVALRRSQVLELEGLFEALQAARERNDLVLRDEKNGVAVRPSDVGVGISQVLPVIVAALYRGERGAGAFVAVEQPELHIHPKLQVELADLFIEQSCAGTVSDHWFLLETHSEHLLLRLLRRIREASGVTLGATSEGEGSVPLRAPTLTPERLSVIYVQRGEDGATKFVPLSVDETGEFRDQWPEGFFEERDPELFG